MFDYVSIFFINISRYGPSLSKHYFPSPALTTPVVVMLPRLTVTFLWWFFKKRNTLEAEWEMQAEAVINLDSLHNMEL